MSAGRGLGKSWFLKSISSFCCSLNSLQKPLMAAATPRYSNFEECNPCDNDWISVAIRWVSFSNSVREVLTLAGKSEEFC